MMILIKPNTKVACFPALHNFHVAVIVGDHIIAGMALKRDMLGMWILELSLHHKKPPKSHALNQSKKIGEASDSPCTMPLEIFMGAEPSLTTWTVKGKKQQVVQHPTSDKFGILNILKTT